mgnify:CR=1 FL=1
MDRISLLRRACVSPDQKKRVCAGRGLRAGNRWGGRRGVAARGDETGTPGPQSIPARVNVSCVWVDLHSEKLYSVKKRTLFPIISYRERVGI